MAKRKPKITRVSIPVPKRVALLRTGERYTGSDRNATYGDPTLNMSVQQELMAVIDKHLVHKNVKGYKAALNNVAIKMARAICGPQPGDDTFIDLAAYAAMAGEILYPEN